MNMSTLVKRYACKKTANENGKGLGNKKGIKEWGKERKSRGRERRGQGKKEGSMRGVREERKIRKNK